MFPHLLGHETGFHPNHHLAWSTGHRLLGYLAPVSNRWIVDRAALRQARAEDLQYVDDPEHLDFLAIAPALGLARSFRYDLRPWFYLKNSLRSTDPVLFISAYLYVAARAGELLAHIKSVTTKLRTMFTRRCSTTLSLALADRKDQITTVLIPFAALYLTLILRPTETVQTKDRDEDKPQPCLTVLTQANVSLQLIATISWEILAMYTLWDLNNEENAADGATATRDSGGALDSPTTSKQGGISVVSSSAQSPVPVEVSIEPGKTAITYAFLSRVLTGMREAYLSDLGLSEEGEVLGMSASVLQGSLQIMHYQNAGMVSGLMRDVGAATAVRSGYDVGEDDESLWVVALVPFEGWFTGLRGCVVEIRRQTRAICRSPTSRYTSVKGPARLSLGSRWEERATTGSSSQT
ncbi:hypothetical protein BKA70DRAFT_1413950 [Coprinopsis sp. MPI-PUGE-AT-0042]|nr:hypothetical protein BKA70DRAFT_1413950 [Coprinopsis sp. MPI-PUGE-AT-0042]